MLQELNKLRMTKRITLTSHSLLFGSVVTSFDVWGVMTHN